MKGEKKGCSADEADAKRARSEAGRMLGDLKRCLDRLVLAGNREAIKRVKTAAAKKRRAARLRHRNGVCCERHREKREPE